MSLANSILILIKAVVEILKMRIVLYGVVLLGIHKVCDPVSTELSDRRVLALLLILL